MAANTSAAFVQAKGLRLSLEQFYAIWRAELTMQWRRRGLWIAFAMITVLFILISSLRLKVQIDHYLARVGPASVVAFLTSAYLYYFVAILCIVVGLLVVDRIKRDESSGITDVQRSTCLSMASYVWGKFLGNYCALVVPCFFSSILLLISFIVAGVTPAISVAFCLSTLLILLPSCAIVVAFMLLFATLVPLRIAQVGFPVLWLWAVIAPLGWPSPADTVLSPIELYAAEYWFYDPQQTLADLEKSGFTLMNAWLNAIAVPLCACLFLLLLIIALRIRTRYRTAKRGSKYA